MPGRAVASHGKRESPYPYQASECLRRETGDRIERTCDDLGVARSTLTREIFEAGLVSLDEALKARVKRRRKEARSSRPDGWE